MTESCSDRGLSASRLAGWGRVLEAEWPIFGTMLLNPARKSLSHAATDDMLSAGPSLAELSSSAERLLED